MGPKIATHHISSSELFSHSLLLVSWHFNDFHNLGLLLSIFTLKVLFGDHLLEKYLSAIARWNRGEIMYKIGR